MTIIGHIYDKAGNLKPVYAPINAKGKEIVTKPVTKFGKLHDSVGYPGFASTEKWVK